MEVLIGREIKACVLGKVGEGTPLSSDQNQIKWCVVVWLSHNKGTCVQKQLNFSFLKVIRNGENIKPDIHW